MQQTVFVVDDDEGARDSLTFLLRAEGLTSRGFASGRALLAELRADSQGCIVTDIRMPGLDGLALVQALGTAGFSLPIIVMTGHADVPLAVQCMKQGVQDFIEKPFEGAAMIKSVRQALELARERGTRESQRATVNSRLDSLTERERQVLDLVVEGLSNKEIGLKLGISFRTVEIYRANVMTKMRADSLAELIRMNLEVAAA